MDRDKIEDRKRPAGGSEDGAPPRKKLAVNGGLAKDDYENQPEEKWIEDFAKGAIYRRMQEYKREAATVHSRLEELHNRSLYHDDHIRIVDAWWRQLVEEIEILVDSSVSADAITPDPPYLSGVWFKDTKDFSRHLDDKTKFIRAKAEALLNRIAAARGDRDSRIAQLESQTAALLAAQKEYLYKLEKVTAEYNDTSEQLNAATLRYFKAEKKLDRVKSSQVQKLEQQALANATKHPSEGAPENSTNNQTSEANGNNAELLQKYEEECAAVSRMKEQVQATQEEVKTLQEENTTLKARREALSDDDFIRTDVFKLFKSKNEELIRQLNHLEATNAMLREEVEKLTAERTNFKIQLEADAQSLTQELDAEVLAKDQDLARVRTHRDEAHAKMEHAKSAAEQESKALEQLRELVSAKDERIEALETEIARLRPSEEDEGGSNDITTELASLEAEELRARLLKLHQDYKAVSSELPAMEKAYRRSMALAHKKVMDFDALESKANGLLVQKNKSDQRYFDARKDADTRNGELRQQRTLNQRSIEIIAQLKDVETQNKGLLANLEKQLADLRQSNTALAAEKAKIEASAVDASRNTEGLKKELGELKSLVKSRDTALAAMREQKQAVEVETDRLRVKADHLQRDRNDYKTRAETNSSDVEKGLRVMAVCSICNEQFKNVVLKTCGHLFCAKCVENRINNRMRKCPTCSRGFDKMDVLSIHL